MKTMITLAVIVVAAAVAWGVLKERVNNNKARIITIEENDLPNIIGDVEYHDDRLYEQEKEVFGLKKEFGHLAEKVDRNFKDQQDFQIEQRDVQQQILTEIKELHK